MPSAQTDAMNERTRWSELDAGTKHRLNGVWCKDGVVIVVGHYGTILRYGP